MRPDQLVDRFLTTAFRYVEKAVLVLVGSLALIAIGQTLLQILEHGEVRLEDLLLIFIFIEIMAMANVYFVRHVVPFTYPMFIAITALARLVVLQGKEISPSNLVFEGGAILLISVAILVVRFSRRYGEDELEDTNDTESRHRD
jgi:protein PsiE